MANDLKFNRNGVLVLAAIGCLMTLFIFYRVGGGSKETVRVSELLSASITLAERGGRRIVEIRKMSDDEIGRLSKGRTNEGKDEYVTLGDKESHDIIVSGLKSLWPNLPLQSEESDVVKAKASPLPTNLNTEVSEMLKSGDIPIPLDDITVWVDPLDATMEYTEGGRESTLLKFVTVMVCVAVKGKPIAGVIHQPYKPNYITRTDGVTKWGWVGHGVSESLIADTVHPEEEPKEPNKIRVISSRSHSGDVKSVAEKAFSEKTVDHIVAAGSGYKVLQVMENRADIYLHTTAIKKWDICAGNAILNAKGGKMTTRRGMEIDYSFIGSEKNPDGLVVALDSNFNDYLRRLKIH